LYKIDTLGSEINVIQVYTTTNQLISNGFKHTWTRC